MWGLSTLNLIIRGHFLNDNVVRNLKKCFRPVDENLRDFRQKKKKIL